MYHIASQHICLYLILHFQWWVSLKIFQKDLPKMPRVTTKLFFFKGLLTICFIYKKVLIFNFKKVHIPQQLWIFWDYNWIKCRFLLIIPRFLPFLINFKYFCPNLKSFIRGSNFLFQGSRKIILYGDAGLKSISGNFII